MLAVREEHRGKGIATKLVRMAIDAMIERDADEVSSHLLCRACSVIPQPFHNTSRERQLIVRKRLHWKQKSQIRVP